MSSAPVDLRGIEVLVVDDNADALGIASATLVAAGAELLGRVAALVRRLT